MNAFAPRWQALAARIDALTLRERAIILVGVVALLWALWDSLLMAPLAAEQKARQQRVTDIQARLETINRTIAALAERRGSDPDAENRARLEALRAEIATIEQGLRGATAGVIEPGRMPAVLERLLAQRTDLKLIELRNLPPEPVLRVTAAGATEAPAPDEAASGVATAGGFNVYRHGVSLVVEGSYFSTLEYLQAVERLPYRFFWDSVRLETKEYPVHRTTITLYTLGLEEDWLGV